MKSTRKTIDEILRILTATPPNIIILCSDLKEEQLTFKMDKKSWSINENLAHLRACADVWGDCIEMMLTKDNPTLVYISPRDWIKRTNYHQLPFHQSLSKFTEQRRQLLSTLDRLDFAEWSQAAIIKGRQHTVFTQARRMAKHEIIHINQIEEIIGSILTSSGVENGNLS